MKRRGSLNFKNARSGDKKKKSPPMAVGLDYSRQLRAHRDVVRIK